MHPLSATCVPAPLRWRAAGGLTAANVGTERRRTGAVQGDVYSGVESTRGVKDLDKISAFIRAASE